MNIEQLDTEARALLAASYKDITRFLSPKRGIAYVGSVDPTEWERKYADLAPGVKACYVNPKGGDGGKYPVYLSVLDLPDEYEAVVVRTAAHRVVSILEDCAQRGIRDVVVFSSGFGEQGGDGAILEHDMGVTARHLGLRVVGPNTNDNMFWDLPIPAGFRGKPMALVTQSGAAGRPLLEGTSIGAAVKRLVATGNEADLEVADFIHYFAQDDSIGAIAIYVEGFKSIPKLKVALEEANRRGKPVVALKIGATDHGAKMTISHTGHLSGSDAAINGLFAQYGVVRVGDLDELLEYTNLFCKVPPGVGPNCMMYTYSGGVSSLMGEVADSYGISMPELTAGTKTELARYLPDYVSLTNPMDNGAVIMHEPTPVKRLCILDALAAAPNMDLLVFGINTAVNRNLGGKMCADVRQWAEKTSKPIAAVWSTPMMDDQAVADLIGSGAAVFRSFKNCFGALKAYAAYTSRQSRAGRNVRPASALQPELQSLLAMTSGTLNAKQTAQLLSSRHIPFVREELVNSDVQALEVARSMGGAVVMKLASPDFPHKSDQGLVLMNVREDSAVACFRELITKAASLDAQAKVDGVVVQDQLHSGVEMIVGLTVDSQCGPCLTIGAGGIYAEVLADALTRPLPVNEDDVKAMINGLRLSPLLDGMRGARPADRQAFIDFALKIADLGLAAAGRISELDFNPVIVSSEGAIAVDALIVSAAKN